MSDSLVVKAKIKEVVGDFNVAGDLADALSEKVNMVLQDAVQRAEENGRKTVMAKDVPFCFACSKMKVKESIIVKSKVKESAKDVNVAGDLADSLNLVAQMMLKDAASRAESNQRKTVMAKDL